MLYVNILIEKADDAAASKQSIHYPRRFESLLPTSWQIASSLDQ
jgi:hypothetical protein